MPETLRNAPVDFIPRDGYDGLLDDLGWERVVIYTVAADASFRRYFRIQQNNETTILMDAPPDKEDVRPFARLAKHLVNLGYRAPRIMGENIKDGFLLLEDLGDDTFTRLLNKGADERELYQLAVDVLCDLHARAPADAIPAGLPAYDDARLWREADLLCEWFYPAVSGHPLSQDAHESFRAAWQPLFAKTLTGPRTLVLRDYHVDNLLRVGDGNDIQACGLLDFQDALAGHPAYDLMSLLEDARRDIDDALAADMLRRYHDARDTSDREKFDTAYAILAAQRHAKVIGIFTRLCVRDGKPAYLGHIPRVWRLLERALTHPELDELRQWFDTHLPSHLRVQPKLDCHSHT